MDESKLVHDQVQLACVNLHRNAWCFMKFEVLVSKSKLANFKCLTIFVVQLVFKLCGGILFSTSVSIVNECALSKKKIIPTNAQGPL